MLRMIELPRISREQLILVNTTYHSRLKGPSPRATHWEPPAPSQNVPRSNSSSPSPHYTPCAHRDPEVPPYLSKGDILAIHGFGQVGPSNQAPIFKSLRRTQDFFLMLTHCG